MEQKATQESESKSNSHLGEKSSKTYHSLKRLIELGAVAGPLVAVMLTAFAPLYSTSTTLLIGYSGSKTFLVFAISALLVAITATVYTVMQGIYYVTRKRRGRHIQYAFGGILIGLCIIVIILDTVFVCKQKLTLELTYFNTILTALIVLIAFVAVNIGFMWAWTWHLKNAGIERLKNDKELKNMKD